MVVVGQLSVDDLAVGAITFVTFIYGLITNSMIGVGGGVLVFWSYSSTASGKRRGLPLCV